MTYVVTNRFRGNPLMLDPARLQRARRRLYAQEAESWRRLEADCTLGWLGVLACIAGALAELKWLAWLLR